MTNHVPGEQLHLYLDGELSRAEAAAVESHLMACKACSLEYEELYQTVRALKELPRKPALAGLEERIDALAASAGADARAGFTLVKHRPALWRMRAVAGAAVVLLVLMVAMQLANKQRANKNIPAKVLNVDGAQNDESARGVLSPTEGKNRADTQEVAKLSDADLAREARALVDESQGTLVLYVDQGGLSGVHEQLQRQLAALEAADGHRRNEEHDAFGSNSASAGQGVAATDVLAELAATLARVEGVNNVEVAWARANDMEQAADKNNSDDYDQAGRSVELDQAEKAKELEKREQQPVVNNAPLEDSVAETKSEYGGQEAIKEDKERDEEADKAMRAMNGVSALENAGASPDQETSKAVEAPEDPSAADAVKPSSSDSMQTREAEQIPPRAPQDSMKDDTRADKKSVDASVDALFRRDGDDWLVFFKGRWVRVKVVERED